MKYRNIVSAFLSNDHKVVCAGYSAAFKYCCDKYNIPCIDVLGDCDGPHAWNYVKIGDEWYMMDVMYNEGLMHYSHFLCGKDGATDRTPSLMLDSIGVSDPDGIFPELAETGFQCTVRFVDYDGTEISTKGYEYGSEVTVPNHPVREGYSSSGWDGIKGAPVYATGDVTYTAKYSDGKDGASAGFCNAAAAAVLLAALSVAAIPVIRYVRL